MKKWIYIMFLMVVAVVGWAFCGGNILIWFAGVATFRAVVRLVLTVALSIIIYVLIYIVVFGGMFWILIS